MNLLKRIKNFFSIDIGEDHLKKFFDVHPEYEKNGFRLEDFQDFLICPRLEAIILINQYLGAKEIKKEGNLYIKTPWKEKKYLEQ